MIDPVLFATPVALDRVQHRAQRLHTPAVRFDRTAGMNSLFVAAVEFIDASRDYPIVFIEAGKGDDGQREVAPVAVLGLTQGENLMLNDDGSWAARYVPALLRGYPLGLARTDVQNYVVVIDDKAGALSATEGELLFNDQGEPSPMLEERRKFVEQLENEAQRTRLLGRSLQELELLQPMRFDATLPDGQQLSVEGFLTVDEKRFSELADDKLVQLHKSGILALIYAHQFSLGLMRGLVERRVARMPRTA
jgi:SapC